MSQHEIELAWQLTHATKYPFQREFRFHPLRMWRADFAVWCSPQSRDAGALPLLVEVEGAIRGKPGHHQRIDGMEEDCCKYAAALLAGFAVLRVMPSQVKSGQALEWIEKLMKGET